MEMALGAALSAVKPEMQLSWKDMFGGAAFYADSMIFAAWFGGGLALRLPEEAHADLLKVEGAVKPWAKAYVEVPPTFLDDTTLLEPWVEIAIAYATTSKKRRKKGTPQS
jgi:TfoX/Sxy family transcriptional regulator of competence genes